MFRYSIVFLCAVLVLSNGYPSSRGSTGHGSRGRGYPGRGNHTYPNSGTNSGNHRYPEVHHHYHCNYSTPEQIHYPSSHGGPAMSYPVYRGSPPTYVYQYKDSGSKYGTLLAGLALFNLGVLTNGPISHSEGHSRSIDYVQQPNEVCLFGVKENNVDFEETRIECKLISSFIYAEQAKQQNPQNLTNIFVTTVTNTAVVNTTNVQDTRVYVLLPNGTLVAPALVLPNAGNATSAPVTGGTVTSSVTTTPANKTTVNAVDVKGPAIQVTPEMQCYVMRRTPSSRMKHEVPCYLLQTYADNFF